MRKLVHVLLIWQQLWLSLKTMQKTHRNGRGRGVKRLALFEAFSWGDGQGLHRVEIKTHIRYSVETPALESSFSMSSLSLLTSEGFLLQSEPPVPEWCTWPTQGPLQTHITSLLMSNSNQSAYGLTILFKQTTPEKRAAFLEKQKNVVKRRRDGSAHPGHWEVWLSLCSSEKASNPCRIHCVFNDGCS